MEDEQYHYQVKKYNAEEIPDWMKYLTNVDRLKKIQKEPELFREPEFAFGLKMWHFALATVVTLVLVFGWLYWMRVRRRRILGKRPHDASPASLSPPAQHQPQQSYYSPVSEGMAPPPVGFVLAPHAAADAAAAAAAYPAPHDPPPPYSTAVLPAYTPDPARPAQHHPQGTSEKPLLM